MNEEASNASGLSSIDKLMMSYVDLSLGSNGCERAAKTSFKGPPLKELKASKKTSGEVWNQPQISSSSQKSIDWKAFDGSVLRNTFVIDNGSSASHDEEWGDFTSCEPTVVSIQPHRSNTKDDDDDDDFSDFISLRASNSSQDFASSSNPSSNLLNLSNLIQISKPISNSSRSNSTGDGSQPPVFDSSCSMNADKYSVFKDISILEGPMRSNSNGSLEYERSGYESYSLSDELQSKRTSSTDFFGLSPEPMSQPVCQSPIPLSGGKSGSTFNILHLHSESSPPEMAPTSDILGPSPLPDSLSYSKNMDSFHSEYSSSSSQPHFSKASLEDGVSLSSNGSTSSHPPFLLNPSSEDRYQAFREVIPSSKEEENPLLKWLRLLRTSHELLRSGASSFFSIDEEATLQEVLSSKRTKDYIVNLIEVYRVSKRIQTSFRFVEEVDASVDLYGQIKEELNFIDKAWCRLLEKVKSPDTEELLYSFLEQGKISCKRRDYSHCGVCCSLINPEPMGYTSKWNNAFCKYGSRQYHSSCANLWLNCVESILPDL